MTRYSDFEKLKDLTTITKTERGFSKFIQTGQLDFHDYGRGFIDLEVYAYTNLEASYVRIWFGTIDDGDFGGWRTVDSHEKAEKITKEIAENVFKDMVAFPTKDELNILLRKYGIAVDYE